MNVLKLSTFFWALLIALAACEQEDAVQRSGFSSADPQSDFKAVSRSPGRDFEVLDLKPVATAKSGYHRIKQNEATGSTLYANIRDGKTVGYLIQKRGGHKTAYIPPNHGNGCPDLYVCIHPETGKYIFYDKCTTDDPCGRPVCSELVWCIHPDTGDYILYDKCKTENPCEPSSPPLVIVSKRFKVNTFCPLTEYTWMIDPETGEYVLMNECSNTTQLFLPTGW